VRFLEWELGLAWEAVKRKGGAGECAVGGQEDSDFRVGEEREREGSGK